MRQPEVLGALRFHLPVLVLALVLVAPVVSAARAALAAAAFLVEFLAAGEQAPLSGLTAAPRRQPRAIPGVAADGYTTPALTAGVPLVLVHGFTPDGKDDSRAVQAAGLLARAGFDVTVPTVPGLTRGRLRPGDVEPVAAAIAAAAAERGRRAVVAGVSVGSGPALLAAADPRTRDRIATVVTLGGYASAHELVRFFLTGEYAFGTARGRVAHDPELVRAFIAANAELLADADRSALATLGPATTPAVLARLSPDVLRLLDALSPEQIAHDIRARLVLIHGRADRAVPYTETLRLAAARPSGTTVILVGLFEHVEGPGRAPVLSHVGDLVTLWGAVYRLLQER